MSLVTTACSLCLAGDLRAQEDYGDAPAVYPTLLSVNGARHKIVPGIFLGTAITADNDGQPDPSATLDQGDDGVTFLTPIVRGNNSTVRVVASATGRLDAWVDFSGNGSWGESGEQVFHSLLLSAGTNNLSLFIPATSVSQPYARFRFSTTGDLSPFGLARDGEVEDYRLTVLAAAADLAISAVISPNPVPAVGGRCVLTVVNSGPSLASNVIISNRLFGVKILEAQMMLGTSNVPIDALNSQLGDLQPNQSRSVVINFRPLQQGLVTATALVRSDVFDPNPNNNQATVTARAAPALVIVTPPQDQKVILGGTAEFSVEAKGAGDLNYQWFVNSNALPTQTGPHLILFNVQQSAKVSVKVSDAFGSIFSPQASLDVIIPVQVSRQPTGVSIPHDTAFQLIADANGTGPVKYQWRLNGANIPNSAAPIYTVDRSTRADAGNYTLVIGNDAGLRFTETVPVICSSIPVFPGSDPFSGAVLLPPPGISPFQGQVQGDTSNATKESGEPDHDGKPGGASVWYQWRAPITGIVTFDTIGSAFDTLLAVYERNTAQGLVPVTSDDDSGGYFRSMVRFTVREGTNYYIVIDGLGGRKGNAVLGWSVEQISQPLPIILTQPQSQSGLSGSLIQLSVLANASPNNPLTYQWFFNGGPVPGGKSATLTISNLTTSRIGAYTVRVANAVSGLFVESKAAIVEIGSNPGIVSRDKLEDIYLNASGNGPGAMAMLGPGAPPFIPVTMGIPGGQVLNNLGSMADIDCFHIGSATRWLGLQVTNTAPPGSVLRVETSGSEILTDLGVYNWISLSCVQNRDCMHLNSMGCDTNSSGGGYGVVNLSPVAGGLYVAFADGKEGALGVIHLNWQLGLGPILDITKSNCTLLYPTGAVVTLQSGFTNGIPTPSYQWYFCGETLKDQTNSTLGFNPIASTNAGCYTVVASNFVGIVTNTCCVIVDPPALKYATDWEAYPPACKVSAALLPATILESAVDLTPAIPWQSVVTNASTNCTFLYASPLYDGYGDPVPQCFFRTRKP